MACKLLSPNLLLETSEPVMNKRVEQRNKQNSKKQNGRTLVAVMWYKKEKQNKISICCLFHTMTKLIISTSSNALGGIYLLRDATHRMIRCHI